jgi:mRNA interferase MazF
MVVARFDVFLVNLDPTLGHEIKKTQPCRIVSLDEMNRNIRTVIIAPMTTAGKDYPTRIPNAFHGKPGCIVLDQLRSVDKNRLVKKLGEVDAVTAEKTLRTLVKMFSP